MKVTLSEVAVSLDAFTREYQEIAVQIRELEKRKAALSTAIDVLLQVAKTVRKEEK